MVKKLLPDIIINTGSKEYEKIFKTTAHELSHASHYAQVGKAYWQQYIDYILQCWNKDLDLYGDRTVENHGYCGVGEMWGYFSGNWLLHKYYVDHLYLDKDDYNWEDPVSSDTKKWFKPQILWELVRDGVLTPREIFRGMTSDVISIDKMIVKLKSLYPNKAKSIETIFRKYYPLVPVVIDPPIIIGS